MINTQPNLENETPARNQKRERLILVCVLFFVLVVRCFASFSLVENLTEDPDSYFAIAKNWAQDNSYSRTVLFDDQSLTLKTAFRPPLYPYFLSWVVSSTNYPQFIALFHVLLAVGTAALIFQIGKYLGLAIQARALAAIFFAVDPIAVFQSAQVMTETIAIFFAVLLLALAIQIQRKEENQFLLFTLGIVSALAVLCRPVFLVWFGFWSIGMLIQVIQKKVNIAKLALPTLAFLLCVAPWAARNHAEFGSPKITTYHGGYTLWLANNESYYKHLESDRWTTVWRQDQQFLDENLAMMTQALQASPPEQQHLWEIDFDRQCYEKAQEAIRNHPVTFVKACLLRVGQFWSPYPNQVSAQESKMRKLLRYGIAIFYLFQLSLAACALISIVRRGGKESDASVNVKLWLWPVVMCLAFTLVHTFFWSNMRMRAPVIPVVTLLSASVLFGSVFSQFFEVFLKKKA